MMCLSLWQPWAILHVTEWKANETRSWPTNIRGRVAIHAAKKQPFDIPGLLDILREDWQHWSSAMSSLGCLIEPDRKLIGLGGLAYGAIVGTVEYHACEEIDVGNAPYGHERAFGDYTPGRYMFMSRNPVRFAKPIPFPGAQGFFNVPDELIAAAV